MFTIKVYVGFVVSVSVTKRIFSASAACVFESEPTTRPIRIAVLVRNGTLFYADYFTRGTARVFAQYRPNAVPDFNRIKK